MRLMRENARPAGKTEAIVVLSRMQSSLRAWLLHSPASEPSTVSYPLWRAQLYEVACCTRSAGLHAHASLSLRIGERLEPSFRSNDLPRSAVELLLCWCRYSLHYVRDTHDFRNAHELVGLLSLSHSLKLHCAKERAYLLCNLLADHEIADPRCARKSSEPGSRRARTS
jgi:hypothetical protein